ncbi:MAG: hypothetical protein MUC99_03005 [Anaerolineae bacterium]|nr:hypothetical protein [Anaerolineae bacterium]
MSNRTDNDNDFQFDEEDLFGSRGRNPQTTDDTQGLDLDNNLDLPDDYLNFEEDPAAQERRGPSRAFIVLAVIIILLFLVGLGGIIFLATRNTGPTERDLTATQIVQLNATQEAFLAATNTQSAVNLDATATAEILGQTATVEAVASSTAAAEFAQTQVAVEATQTAEAIPTETPEPSITPTLDAAGEAIAAEQTFAALPPVAQITAQVQTQEAQAIIAQATAEAGTAVALQTEAALQPPTATGAAGPSFGDVSDVLQTATALSLTLSPQTAVPATADPGSLGGTPFIVPTADGGTGGTGGTGGNDRLPDTGLFDDVSGVGNLGLLGLMALGLVGMALGLVGIMIAARRLRK